MKRIFALLLLCALLCGLCGCGDYVSLMPGQEIEAAESDEFVPTGLGELLGWEDFLAAYYDDTPAAVSYQGQAGFLSPIFDRESIIRACDTLRSITAEECLGEKGEDDEISDRFVFTMSDGSRYELEFSDGRLCFRDELYTVEGAEALYELEFPGYGGDFDIFDLYYDSSVTDFAQSFESVFPTAVGRRANGGAVISNHSEDMIRQVFSLLESAQIESVEMSPDQNIDLNTVQEYVFTLPDGSGRSFVFTGNCLTVQVSEAYGPVYYHITTADEIAALSIAAANSEESFAGGTIGELRSDIARAVAVSNGEYTAETEEQTVVGQASRTDDGEQITEEQSGETTQTERAEALTVAGVYVSFDINGVQDYISLTGDEATAFVQQLGQLQVTADMPEGVPEGEEITVSVNLSDWSGPIIYFCSGNIQKTVGHWYVCNAEDYALLQSRIMDIYYVQVETRMDTETAEAAAEAQSSESTAE